MLPRTMDSCQFSRQAVRRYSYGVIGRASGASLHPRVTVLGSWWQKDASTPELQVEVSPPHQGPPQRCRW